MDSQSMAIRVLVHSTAETPKLESPLIENPSVNQWIDSEPELKKDHLADLGIVDDDDDVIVDEVEKEVGDDQEVGDEEVGDKRREDEELTASLVFEEKFDDFGAILTFWRRILQKSGSENLCSILKSGSENLKPLKIKIAPKNRIPNLKIWLCKP
jgi:hypothetical protein